MAPCDVLGQIGQGQRKIQAKILLCNDKDFDRGRRSVYTTYVSATPLLKIAYMLSYNLCCMHLTPHVGY